MKICLTFFFLFLGIQATIGCDCIYIEDMKTLDSISYEGSDLIVIGIVTKINDANYKIKISKILKGKIEFKEIIGTYSELKEYYNSCAFHPREEGEYLLYLNKTNKSRRHFFASHCLGTRLLERPTKNIHLQGFSLEEAKALTEESIKFVENKEKK